MNRRRPAFTIVELLVVIAIISLLLAILIPTLSGARAQAQAVYCRTRLGELSRCAYLYTNDWDVFPPCIDNYAASGLPVNPPGQDWLGIGNQSGGGYAAGDPQDPNTGNPKGFLAAPRHGLLYKYFLNDDLVLCPSDSFSSVPGTANPNDMVAQGNGQFSFSMLAGLGLRAPSRVPKALTMQGEHVGTISDIPLFVEENPAATGGQGGINANNMEGNCWTVDTLVSRHKPGSPRLGRRPGGGPVTTFVQGETNIGFADGHAVSIRTNYGMNENDMLTTPNIIGNNVKGFMTQFTVRTWAPGGSSFDYLAIID
jgi:prepilin-type N-terminal cleavage/methylation domain-containing protein/prepilin-type processing-associated H-X9-DG protein